MRGLLLVLMTVASCTSSSPDTSASGREAGPATPQTFVYGERFCVAEAMTVQLPPERQAPVLRPVGACGNYVSAEAMAQNPISCGPCGFSFDPEVTEQARARRPDACCYAVSSPPPPPPPSGLVDPAHRCESAGDCQNDCALGAINRRWLERQTPRGQCRDGCTAKGTEPPRCEAGVCIAYRLGERYDSCTQRPVSDR